jgi:hypothetical protein
MAKAFKCDRCGIVRAGNPYSGLNSWGMMRQPDQKMELCKECAESFSQWWKSGNESSEEER